MAQTIKIGDLTTVLEKRIQTRLQNLSPKSPRIKEVLMRIGLMIETQAKINIRRQHLIDTGTLLNSIKYVLFQRGVTSGVEVGSFGVPYAAAHEFGFEGPVNVRSFTRNQTVAFGKRIPAKPVTVSAHTRFMRVRERPYLRPAVRKVQAEIADLIKGLVVRGPQ